MSSTNKDLISSKLQRRTLFTTWLTALFDWYDFLIYTAFASMLAKHFFSGLPSELAYLSGLAASLTGFIFRPLGALILSPLGDKVGRKYAFLICMILMCVSTVGVGLLPGYGSIGIAAPIVLICFRMLQGIAMGGEYGNAYTFINEHAPLKERAKYASIIQSSSLAAFALTLFVAWLLEEIFGTKSFQEWAWRLAFLVAAIFFIISLVMRMHLEESPTFLKIRSRQQLSKNPLSEVFKTPRYTSKQLIFFFGFISSHSVVVYSARAYVFVFLTATLQVLSQTANMILGLASIAALPSFWLGGYLADRYGRKKILLSGAFVFAIILFPAYEGLAYFANPTLGKANTEAPAKIHVDSNACSDLSVFDTKPKTDCDKLKQYLIKRGVNFEVQLDYPGAKMSLTLGTQVTQKIEKFEENVIDAALQKAGYPDKKNKAQPNLVMLFLISLILLCCGGFYGPISTLLAESFPTRVRVTALSFPYNLGHGLIGGSIPTVAYALVIMSGNIFFGLVFPISILLVSIFIGIFFLKNDQNRDLDDETI